MSRGLRRPWNLSLNRMNLLVSIVEPVTRVWCGVVLVSVSTGELVVAGERRRVHRQTVRLLHARLQRQQLPADGRLLLLRARRWTALLPLSPGMEPLPLRRVRRPRSHAVRI